MRVIERELEGSWVVQTLKHPDWTEMGPEGNLHYMARIPEFGGRILRVVVSQRVEPPQIVTIFFDRRIKRER
ncbi:MAG: DUF4258 domain-containing protein [Calditrichaeota bacterium]|nr:DUF4258 domain-containing protein [Calditrichota bacterium]